MIALLACAFASLAAPSTQDEFPELRRDPERTRRGLVILAGREAAWSELAIEDTAPRIRLEIAESGEASAIEADHETRVLLVPGTTELVNEPALVRKLESARSFVFDDASAVDWSRALYPRQRRTELASTLWRRHLAGADVLAFERSAAAISAVCPIEPSSLEPFEWVERNPRKEGRSLSFWSLGFLPWALVDVAGTQDASFDRLIERAWRDRMRLCLWLPEDAVLVADVAVGRATARGTAPIVWIDLKRARRSRQWLLGGYMSILCPGATWEHEQRRVQPHEGTSFSRRTSTDQERRLESTDSFGDATLSAICEHFAQPAPARTLRIVDEKRELVLLIDDASALYSSAHGTSLVNRVRFDLHERD